MTQVTDFTNTLSENFSRIHELKNYGDPSLVRAIGKLAAVGERAGFTLEAMIQLLDSGASVEMLLELIILRLESQPPQSRQSANWVM